MRIKWIVLGALFAPACLWLLLTRGEFPPPDPAIVAIAVSESGQWIAAGTRSGTVTVRARKAPDREFRFDCPNGVLNSLEFTADERWLAVANRDLTLWPLGNSGGRRVLRADRRNYGSIHFDKAGGAALTIDGTGAIRLLDASSGALRRTICCSTIYGEVAFTPDGARIASAGHWPAFWDAASGRLIARLTHERQFHAFGPVAFDVHRGLILMGSQDGRVYASNLLTGALEQSTKGQPGYVDSIAVAGRIIAYKLSGGTLRAWNPETGEDRTVPGAHPSSNLAADGPGVVFGAATGRIERADLQ